MASIIILLLFAMRASLTFFSRGSIGNILSVLLGYG